MRLWLSGPRIFGVRPGISFALGELLRPAPPHELPRSPPSGYVYVIKSADNQVKIGVTGNPERRLAQIRATSPSKLDFAFVAPVSGDPYAVEKLAHQMLAQHPLHGEWFETSPELAIAAVAGAAARLGQSLITTSTSPVTIGIGWVAGLIFGSAALEALAATAGFPTAAGVIFVVYAIIISYISWVSWKAGR